MGLTTQDFSNELTEILKVSEDLGLIAVEVKSGNLHRRVGGYPGQNHRMPICWDAMYKAMTVSILKKHDSGKGASVVIRYQFPR